MAAQSNRLTIPEFAKYFDHTLLRADATDGAFDILCDDSMSYGFAMVAINPVAVSYCKRKLRDSDVHVGAAIGFPLGQNTMAAKLFETKDALQNGADEIDYVIDITRLKAGDHDYIYKEMKQIVAACREYGATSKVIFENCYLTDDEKRALCGIAKDVKPDFIKTSTGFGTGGATVCDVKLMLDGVKGTGIKVKAAGGVRTLEAALEMIDLGVQRIGTSASLAIVDAYKAKLGFGASIDN